MVSVGPLRKIAEWILALMLVVLILVLLFPNIPQTYNSVLASLGGFI